MGTHIINSLTNGPIGGCVISGSSPAVLQDERATTTNSETLQLLPDTPLFHNHSDSHAQAMSGLQQLYLQERELPENSIELRGLWSRALNDGNRSTRLLISGMEFGFLLVQFCIILLLLDFALGLDNFDVVWRCPGGMTNDVAQETLYFICLAIGIARPFVDSSFVQPREILHLRSLPPSIHVVKCEDCSLAMVPPPARQLRLFSRIISYFRRKHALFWLSRYTAFTHLTHCPRIRIETNWRAAQHISKVFNYRLNLPTCLQKSVGTARHGCDN